MRLMSAAAFRYDSSRVGESDCSSAMLSKLALFWSSGSQLLAFTSRSSSSRIARSYSGRFRRWNVRRPGFGLLAACSSMRVSSAAVSDDSTGPSGRLAPGGGMRPALIFRIIFSTTSGCCCAFIASQPASDRPPAFARSL